MKRLLTCLCIFCSLFGYVACTSTSDSGEMIAADFTEYTDRFLSEAEARGMDFDLLEEGISIAFAPSGSQVANGRCFLASNDIEIDRSSWNVSGDLEKERLIFHELGHCLFDRPHLNEFLTNGDRTSLMTSMGPIYYRGFRREYYINELFDRNTAHPAWGETKEPYEKTGLQLMWTLEDVEDFSETVSLDARDAFDLEVLVEGREEIEKFGFSYGSEADRINVFINSRGLLEIIESNWGRLVSTDFYEDILNPDLNKITLRKEADTFHIFINEVYVNTYDEVEVSGGLVNSEFTFILQRQGPLYKQVQLLAH